MCQYKPSDSLSWTVSRNYETYCATNPFFMEGNGKFARHSVSIESGNFNVNVH
jgi:hypothetical protein